MSEVINVLKKLEPKYGKTYPPKQVIFQEGDMGTEVYYILSGRVQVSAVYNEEGKSHVLTTLGVGDVFGELAVLGDLTRSATVKTLEKTKVVVMKRDAFYQAIRSYPDLAVEILQLLGKHILRLDANLKKALSIIVDKR